MVAVGIALLAVMSSLDRFGGPPAARGQGMSAGAQDSSGVIAGVLRGAEAGEPIAYATVTLANIGRSSFADANGSFRVGRLAPGDYRLRVRQIGYTPLDTTVTVVAGPSETTLSLRLRRVALRLARIAVTGRRVKGCVATGVPDSTVNPQLAGIFAQVRENVDRFRLLLDEYPFAFSREERHFIRLQPGGDSTRSVDTVGYDSRARRPYRIGEIVYTDFDAVGRRTRFMYLPTFRELADSAFLAAHCFSYGGTELLGGHGPEVFRVDFRPASRISVPDVEGSVYLDAQRFVVRRAVFNLTKPQAAQPPVLGLSVTTTFRELVPLVPVFDTVESDQPLPAGIATSGDIARGDALTVVRAGIEQDRLLGFNFLERSPGEQSPSRPGAEPNATPTAAASPGAPSGSAPGASSAGVLTGRVVQGDGTPVAGASVSVFGMRDSVATSDSGTFTVSGAGAGPRMVSVRRLGFEAIRLPVTIARDRPTTVTITVVRSVPVLPTVVTTAVARAYHDIGLDRRMKAGNGQFLTAEQIQRRQATKLTQLLEGMRGFDVQQDPKNFNKTIRGTRGVGSCVGFVIDGVPQAQLASQTIGGSVLPPDDADNLIDPSAIAAIEVYSASERPAEFGTGLHERPETPPDQPAPVVDLGAQQCALVVIWTRSRLGLASAQPAAASESRGDIRARPVFPDITMCEPKPADDTIASAVYAALQGQRPQGATDMAWSSYIGGVFAALRSTLVLPTDLPLPVFSYPFNEPPANRSAGSAAGSSLAAAPAFSAVIAFTLDSAGTVGRPRIGASSLSGTVDTSLLAAVVAASAGHRFPTFPPALPAGRPVSFDLIVSTGHASPGDRTAVLAHLFTPIWMLKRTAALSQGSQPSLAPATGPIRLGTDSVTLEFVVDERGRAALSTVRAIDATGGGETTDPNGEFITQLVRALPGFRFDPALIGGCPVRQMMTAGFSQTGVMRR